MTDPGDYTFYVEEVPDGQVDADCVAGPVVRSKPLSGDGLRPEGRGGAALCVAGTSLLMLGGATRTQQHFPAVHRLGLSEGASWEVLPAEGASVAGRSGQTAVAVAGSQIWTFGGVDMSSGSNHCDVHVLDLAAVPPQWRVLETSGASPAARNSHTAVLLANSMVVFGGANDDGPLGDVAALSFEDRVWRVPAIAAGDAPQAREMHAACATSSAMYVLGGRLEDQTICEDFWVLRIGQSAWSWQQLAKPEDAICACSLQALADGRLLVFGGWDGMISILKNAAIYNCDEDSWSELAVEPAPPERFAHASAVAPDGRSVFIFGGINVSQDLSDILQLIPPPPGGSLPQPGVD